MIKFQLPACPVCEGSGAVSYDWELPQVCDHCDGAGYKVNVLGTMLVVVIAVVTTVLPVWWFW